MPEPLPNFDTVFCAAIDIASAPERAAYIAQACGDDAALRAQVEKLVAAHFRAGNFLESPEPQHQGTVDQPVSSAHPGTTIGPYKLIEPIGEGGMGTVWMAQQTEPVKRVVALKLIKAGMDSKQVIARFEAERQALALMDHPNIAKVLDGGTTPPSPPSQGGAWGGGRPYFVMDLVKGVPITRYCDEHHLTPRQRLELFVPVCHAVQHAHQKGIIHRDLKPSNVLVALYDGRPVPKVIDFGVAKAAGQSLTDKTLVTGFGNIVGTLEYMSPEQAEVNQLDIDTRSDIYSLGVLLYELLTGSPPFSRKDLEKAGMVEMLRVIREEEPSKPSTKLSTAEGLPTLAANRGTEPAKLTKLVRGELDWIVMKALEKDRNRRYETANGFAMDVQRYLADEPVQACPPSAWYRFGKFARRNKGRLAVSAGMFLALTVMAATIGWSVRDRAAREAEVERQEAARRAKVTDEVSESLTIARTLLAENQLVAARQKLAAAHTQMANDRAVLGDLAVEVEALEAEVDRFREFLDLIDRAHEGKMSDGKGGARPAAPVLLKALRHYAVLERDDWTSALEGGLLARTQVEQIRRSAYEELLRLAADVHGWLQEHRSGQSISREEAARQALVYLGKAESAHRPTQALFNLRARCRQTLGEDAAAKADRQLAEKTSVTMAVDHYLRGEEAYAARQSAEAVQAFGAALRLEPTHYWSLMKLGYCLSDLGKGPEDFAGAVWIFTGCILKRPEHAHAYYCRTLAYFKLRRYEEAASDYSRAYRLDPREGDAWREATGNPLARTFDMDPKDVRLWLLRGVTYMNLRQYDLAVADYSRAIELAPKDANGWGARGNAYIELGQADKALADFSKALELAPQSGGAWENRAVAYSKLGQADKAIADFSRAIELGVQRRYGFVIYVHRAEAYRQMDRFEQALADYETAMKMAPPDQHFLHSGLAWLLASRPHPTREETDRAIEEATTAVEKSPVSASWKALGVAQYRAGKWQAAIVALDRSATMYPAENAVDHFFLAMAHWKLGHRAEACAAYEQAMQSLEKNKHMLEQDRGKAAEFRRFRSEAEELLELKKK